MENVKDSIKKKSMRSRRYLSLLLMASLFTFLPKTSAPAQVTEFSQLRLAGVEIGKERRGPKIPQTRDRSLVPQGLEYIPLTRWYVLTAYVHKNNQQQREASKLSVVDEKSGKRVKTVHLYENSHRKHVGHVGGVTFAKKHLYVASTVGKKNLLLRYRLKDLQKVKDGEKLMADKVYQLPHRTSYIKYYKEKNWLLIGQWVPHDGEKEGTLQAYRLDSQGDPHHVREFRTPKSVQGMEVVGDVFFYSVSYNRRSFGKLYVFKGLGDARPLGVYPLKKSMNQNLALVARDNRQKANLILAISTEAGADKYFDAGIKPDDRIGLYPLRLDERRLKDERVRD